MTKRGMLGAVSNGTRTVMRFINANNGTTDIGPHGGSVACTTNTGSSDSPPTRRPRTKYYKRRDNRLRKQADSTHPYVKFNAVSPTTNENAGDQQQQVDTLPRKTLFPQLLGSKNFDPCAVERHLNCGAALLIYPELFCDTQNHSSPPTYELSEHETSAIVNLLSKEMCYQPNTNFLYYVNPQVDDKVDANLRNEAIFNLRFIHNGFFALSPDTFCKAVNLMDRFIVKVKVKPKYTSCVATACYYIASKLTEGEMAPTAEALVQIARCGGTATDLRKMVDIIREKLSNNMDSVTTLDFVRAFLVTNATGGAPLPLSPGLTTRLLIALCSLEVYKFRPACMALSVLLQEGGLKTNIPLSKLEALATFCDVEWSEVEACADLMQELYEAYYRQPLPSSRDQLVWTLSRRTLSRMVSSSPTPLDTISEDAVESSDDEELLLDLLFEN